MEKKEVNNKELERVSMSLLMTIIVKKIKAMNLIFNYD